MSWDRLAAASSLSTATRMSNIFQSINIPFLHDNTGGRVIRPETWSDSPPVMKY
jgi:hypothetical protein